MDKKTATIKPTTKTGQVGIQIYPDNLFGVKYLRSIIRKSGCCDKEPNMAGHIHWTQLVIDMLLKIYT